MTKWSLLKRYFFQRRNGGALIRVPQLLPGALAEVCRTFEGIVPGPLFQIVVIGLREFPLLVCHGEGGPLSWCRWLRDARCRLMRLIKVGWQGSLRWLHGGGLYCEDTESDHSDDYFFCFHTRFPMVGAALASR